MVVVDAVWAYLDCLMECYWCSVVGLGSLISMSTKIIVVVSSLSELSGCLLFVFLKR